MEGLLHKTCADRVWVFSNWKQDGQLGYDAKGCWYCDFEVVSGLASEIEHYQHVPVSMLAEDFDKANRKGFSCLGNAFQNCEERSLLHGARGAASYYGQSIYDREGQFVGGVGCDWVYPDGYNYERIAEIARVAREIEDLLLVNVGRSRKIDDFLCRLRDQTHELLVG